MDYMGKRRILVTGGAGFIGSNITDHFLQKGDDVVVFDNLYRPGVKHNIQWLLEKHGEGFNLIEGDVRDFEAVLDAVKGAQIIFHTAGQTAVTTSVENPRDDFQINALGALNVLESARAAGDDAVIFYTSTNKVYGRMADMPVVENDTRYMYEFNTDGVNESQPLDFHSPYGCSKGAADQYMHDYSRIYGMKTIVFRMGSIYGPHQFGMEDQAWIAYFVIAAVNNWPITIYGDGKQVRDVLFIRDLLWAFELAAGNIEVTAGQIYNIGGGFSNTISIWNEFAPLLSRLLGKEVEVKAFEDWRPGDQKVYFSDIQKAKRDFGWQPEVGVQEGIQKLVGWVKENQGLFEK